MHDQLDLNIGSEKIHVTTCSNELLMSLYEQAHHTVDKVPSESDVEKAYLILDASELNWVLLESESSYHTVIWKETESNLFRRCA